MDHNPRYCEAAPSRHRIFRGLLDLGIEPPPVFSIYPTYLKLQEYFPTPIRCINSATAEFGPRHLTERESAAM